MDNKDYMLIQFDDDKKMIVFNGNDSKNCLNVKIYDDLPYIKLVADYNIPTRKDVDRLYTVLGIYLNGLNGKI